MFRVILFMAKRSLWICEKALAYYEKYTCRPYALILSRKIDMLHKIKEETP